MGSAHEQPDGDGGRNRADGAGVRVSEESGQETEQEAEIEPEKETDLEESEPQQAEKASLKEPEPQQTEEVNEGNENPAGEHHLEGLEPQMIDGTTEQELSEAEEEIASALSLPELPSVEEQIRAIEEPMAALYAGEIAVPADVVDEVLRTGTNRQHGHLRIIYNFMIDQTPKEYTEFVKREYGTGGKGLVIDGKEYSVWFNELGMQVAVGHTVTDKILDKAFLSWEDVSGRIGQLLAQGMYAPQVVLDAARSNALTEHAEMLAYMERDMAEGVAELVFADMEVFQGGFPDMVERLSSLLEHPEFLADLNDRLEGLAAAYEEDPELMRFRTYNPVRVAAEFQKFARTAVPYQAREGYAWEEHGHFITQDEVDAFLSGGGPYSNARLSTYSYFCMEHTDAEKTAFLKEAYGTGGSSHALSGADDSHADYDAKGLRLERGPYGNPYAKEHLTWAKAAQRVDYLIKQDLFLKPADYSRMDAYEKEQMANRVRSFYSRLPMDVQRPFPDDMFGDAARAFLTETFEDDGRTQELIAHMSETLAALPLDFERYEERAQILTDLIQYTEGTYTLFPERKREPEMITGKQMTLFDLMGMEEPEGSTEETVGEPEYAAVENVGKLENTAEEIVEEPQEHPHENADEQETTEPVAEQQGQEKSKRQAEQAEADNSSEADSSDGFVAVTEEDEIPFEKTEPEAVQELQPLGADAAAEYNAIKERYPNTLVGFEQHGHYEFYGEDARLASQILGSRLMEKQTDNGVVDVTGFPSGQWVYYSKKLWSKGESVYLAGELEDGTHRQIKYLSGREYLPLNATVHINGREFRIDTVNFQTDEVSLQDMTMAREARYPIFRVEPTGYVRALYEEEEPEFDFDTENRVANAMEYVGVSHEDFSGEQMDVIYDAALKELNIEPMLNPDFSPEQMQLIADIAERAKAGERAAFEGVMAPVSGHVMTPDEINAVRRSYRLPLDTFEPAEEPETTDRTVFEYQGYHFKPVGRYPEHGDFVRNIVEADPNLEPLMSDDEEAEIPYDYEEFYRASGAPDADIFLCVENGENYIPGNHELFVYDGEYEPYLEAEEERSGEIGKEPSERVGGTTPKLKSIVLELNPEPQERQEPINFHITDDDLGAGGPKAKFKANMDAIWLLKDLEENGRLATAEEQEILSRFVGWGGIPQAFDAENASWASEYAEVKEVLSPEEYREARASTLNAFYTSPTVIKAMYSALENMGLRSGNVLDKTIIRLIQKHDNESAV
ncbi:MAG: DNA methylase, partial [Clostridiales bacterium]|nr:DNA methylase [Clostridiales bacterium]